jgi:UTP--glucose-1-phosphate uridylyltransferase
MDALRFEEWHAHYFYTRQRVQRGLGDAILCGENFAGEQPFVVALGDSIVGLNAQSKAVSRMVELFEQKHASCVIAVEEVPMEETMHYGVVAPARARTGIFESSTWWRSPSRAKRRAISPSRAGMYSRR